MKQQATIFLSLFSCLAVLPQLTRAALCLPDIQPIAGFTDACKAAYSTPISACPEAKTFVNFSGTCTKDCFVGLNEASTSIQKACQFAAAHGDTVIAHAFKGDLSLFLCEGNLKGLSGDGNGSGSGNGDDNNNSGTVVPTATNVITTASGINPTPVPTTTFTSTTKTSAATSMTTTATGATTTSSSTDSSSSTSSSSSSRSQSPSASPTTFATSSTSSASPSSTADPNSHSSTAEGGIGNGSGSSDSTPFDQGTWDEYNGAISFRSPIIAYTACAAATMVSLLIMF